MKPHLRNHLSGRRFLVAAALPWLCLEPPTFAQTADNFNRHPSDGVIALAVQPDGKTILGGFFSYVDYQPQQGLARVNPDGTLDRSFPGASWLVNAVALQPDGKVLAGGVFGKIGDTTRTSLARIDPSGAVDLAFNPVLDGGVSCLAVQADGKILLGGWFGNVNGAACGCIARLNSDGSVDDGFNPGAGDDVTSIILQPDGKILVGGWFNTLGGQTRNCIGRLNADGTLDTNFIASVTAAQFPTVNCLLAQPDGKVVVAGAFTTVNGQARTNLARLNADGSIDTTFDPSPNAEVFSLAQQIDGRLLVAGGFSVLAGQPRSGLGRLNTNGTLDSGFNAAITGQVSAIAMQADGRLVLGGWFDAAGGQSRRCAARLTNTAAATQSLGKQGSAVHWLRDGTGPELVRTTFDYSGDGVNWTSLGAGTRIPGGWQANAGSLPAKPTFRARGFLQGGKYQGSGQMIELISGSLAISQQPLSRTNDAGTLAAFNVLAGGGSGAITYQWRRAGTNLADSGNISGVNTASLLVSNVSGADRAFYTVVVTSGADSLTSEPAQLEVLDPRITGHPVSQSVSNGQTATFTVSAIGTPPVGYLWLRNSTNLSDTATISGSRTATLTLIDVLGGDAGAYAAVVTNAYGSVTSLVASLTVADPILVSQPVSQAVAPGQSVTFSFGVTGTEPFRYEWRKDGEVLAGADGASLVFNSAQGTDAGYYQVVASNAYGAVTSAVVSLTVNLASADSLNPGANDLVLALSVMAEDQIVVGGRFTRLGGQTRLRVGQLNADGAVDVFYTAEASGTVRAIACDGLGSSFFGGEFSSFSSLSQIFLAKFPDPIYSNPNGPVSGIALQADGKVLVGGSFTTFTGLPRNYLGRVSPNGTLDPGFDPGANGPVLAFAVQPDARIVVGGAFTTIGGQARTNLARLNPDGSVDDTFNPGADGSVYALVLQPDGAIVVGGTFTALGGQTRLGLGRVLSSGALDPSFNPGITRTVDPCVYTLALQTDGKIIVGGMFYTLGGVARNGLGRLEPNGAVDLTFNPADGWVYSLAIQKDGAILVGGGFQSLGVQPRSNIGRLNNTQPAMESLLFDDTSVTWRRSGSSPELWRATFECTTNGADWVPLAHATRATGGWQAAGLAIPPGVLVRARGFVAGGSWFVETRAGNTLFTAQPVSQTLTVLATANFSASAVGVAPLSYQWLREGVPLVDSVTVSGARTSALSLAAVLGGDAGQYQVVVSNSWGSITSAVATLTVIDPLITAQPVSQFINVGQNASFSVTVVGTGPIGYQWWRGGVPLVSATNSLLTVTNAQGGDAGAYSVVAGNFWGSVTSQVATLTVNLASPDGFNPGSVGSAGPFLFQPDGKILIAGSFGSALNRRYLARFSPDGSPDLAFIYSNVVVDISSTHCLALQTDGCILGSGFSRQQQPSSLWRLNANGTVDASFTNALAGSIDGLARTPDGWVWAAGNFSYLKPSILTNLALIQPDGAVDTNLLVGVTGTINTLALQPDGKLLAGGGFTFVNGQVATRLARLTTNGLLDASFTASANSTVNCLLVQPDGRILVAGAFTTLNGANVNRLGRLNPDGSLDPTFNPNVNSTVYSLALQTDGRIVIGGIFGAVSGQPRNRLARLKADGSLDLRFNPIANGTISSVGLQADGAVLVTGSFSQMTGQYRTNIARLAPTEPALQSLSYDGTALTWLRGGTAPEVWRTTFEFSTNGSSWTRVGAGERIGGGWRMANVTLPAGAYVRARGFTTGSANNGASWFVESTLGPPLLTSQPAGRTNLAGTTATFWVSAAGSEPLSYQWRRNGQPLADGGNLSGVNTPSLVISNVLGGNMGRYSVVVSNSGGSVTSAEATLLVIEPIITTHPVSVFTNAGQAVTFSVTALGTAPLTYQWGKDGTNLIGATAPTLALPSAQVADIGAYRVVVLGPFGGASSGVATLTLNLALPGSLAPDLDDEVRSLATQPDGRILIGGNFNHLDGEWFWEFGRLNADGTRDTNFNGHVNSSTDTVAVQPDGNILAGGWFNYANDWPHSRIARFYPDGGLDPAVNPVISSSTLTPFVDSLVPQPDGKFLIGGWFTSLAGQARNYIGRFNADGSLDTFNPGANTHVMVLALQSDGKVVAGGNFTLLGGQTRNRIGRLNPDGSLDTSFDPNANSTVNAVVLQPDGKILVGGGFTAIAGQNRGYLVRLNPNGTLDATFNPNVNAGVSGIALQADGSVLIAGGFTAVGGQSRGGLARVNSLGIVDPYWVPQVAGEGVGGFAIQSDGSVLMCGSFTNVCGQPRSRLARLEATTTAEHRLECDAAGVTWWRGGSSPEVSGVHFEISTDGTNWTSLGQAVRIPGGWRTDTSLLAINARIRARGFHSGGRWNGSLSLIEETMQVSAQTRPLILSEDSSFGFQASQFGFTVRALPGQTIVIEAGPDLRSWLPVRTNSMTARDYYFTDPESAASPGRLYRARAD